MRGNIRRLLLALAIPLALGGLAALLSGGMDGYRVPEKPPLSPPGWVFPVVWTGLYLLMGYASYLVYTADAPGAEKKKALWLYGVQLLVNGLWPTVFFAWERYLAALGVLAVLWALVLLTAHRFSRIRERAGDLLIPYLLWVSFAAYLNFGVFLLN